MARQQHRIALILAVAYLLALAGIAFWPTPVDRPVGGALAQAIGWLHTHGLPSFIGYGALEFTANILLFAPLGYVVSAWWSARWWHAALTGCAVSCLIEIGQALFLPNRYASALDIVANTLGAVFGAGIFVLAHRRPMRRSAAIPGSEVRDAG